MRVADLFSHASIGSVASKPLFHIKEVISSYDFEPVGKLSQPEKFDLGNYSRSVESLLNYEAARFGCAALETYLNICHEPISHKSLNWALIRCYYSAFFAAHACIRTTGYFVSRLDKSSVATIQKTVDEYYPGSVKPFTGTYKIKYDPGTLQINFEQTESSGGYHESFWPVFLQYLNLGFTSPLSSQVAFQDEILLLSAIRDNLLGSGNYAWLSEIRNRVNYQLPNELWYPYVTKDKAPLYDQILKGLNSRKEELSDYSKLTSTQTYNKFVGTCDAVMDLMISGLTMFFAQSQIRNNTFGQTFKRLLDVYEKSKYAA